MLGSLTKSDLALPVFRLRFRVIISGWWRLDTSVLDSVSLCQPVINMTTSDRWQCWHHSHLVLSTWYTLSEAQQNLDNNLTKRTLTFTDAMC